MGLNPVGTAAAPNREWGVVGDNAPGNVIAHSVVSGTGSGAVEAAELTNEDYAAHGVGEYWIVDPVAETIEQYVLHEGVYGLAVKVKTGTITSAVVPGFEIPVRAVFDGAAQLAARQAILAE